MSTNFDTVVSLLKSTKRVVLFPHSTDDIDAVAASLALAETLTNLGIQSSVVLDKPSSLSFLPGAKLISNNAESDTALTIEIPSSQNVVQSISYSRTNNALKISVTQSGGTLTPDSVKVSSSSQSVKSVYVIVGAPNLRALGSRFTDSAEQFYKRPTIAISHSLQLTPFATVTLNEPSANSCSEIVYSLVRAFTKTISPSTATALLAGIFATTQSFQRPMTSPAEFDLAAKLIELKADRHTVVKHLYKTKPLPALKLWGRVLSQLRADRLEQAWFSQVSQRDFSETSTSPRVLLGVINDIVAQSSKSLLVAISYEISPSLTGVIVATPRTPLTDQFATALQATTANAAPNINPHTSTAQNGDLLKASIALPLTEATKLVQAVGEQIVHPGYTAPNATGPQKEKTSRYSATRRETHAGAKSAA